MEERIGCVVMAAGNGSRFGGNKLFESVGGTPLIERTLAAVPEGLFARVAVVTQYPEIRELAEKHGFSAILNDQPDLGASRTVALGTRALRDCAGILYLVADQPFLSAESVALVVKKWLGMPDRIVSAAHGARRGNPCIFPQSLFPDLEALSGDRGGSAVIRAHPELLTLQELPERELLDIDTQETLRALREKTE